MKKGYWRTPDRQLGKIPSTSANQQPQAMAEAAPAGDEALLDGIERAAFEYFRPTSLDEAVTALRDAGEDSKIIAGGQSLMPVLRLRLAAPSALVDLGRVARRRDEGDRRAGPCRKPGRTLDLVQLDGSRGRQCRLHHPRKCF